MRERCLADLEFLREELLSGSIIPLAEKSTWESMERAYSAAAMAARAASFRDYRRAVLLYYSSLKDPALEEGVAFLRSSTRRGCGYVAGFDGCTGQFVVRRAPRRRPDHVGAVIMSCNRVTPADFLRASVLPLTQHSPDHPSSYGLVAGDLFFCEDLKEFEVMPASASPGRSAERRGRPSAVERVVPRWRWLDGKRFAALRRAADPVYDAAPANDAAPATEGGHLAGPWVSLAGLFDPVRGPEVRRRAAETLNRVLASAQVRGSGWSGALVVDLRGNPRKTGGAATEPGDVADDFRAADDMLMRLQGVASAVKGVAVREEARGEKAGALDGAAVVRATPETRARLGEMGLSAAAAAVARALAAGQATAVVQARALVVPWRRSPRAAERSGRSSRVRDRLDSGGGRAVQSRTEERAQAAQAAQAARAPQSGGFSGFAAWGRRLQSGRLGQSKRPGVGVVVLVDHTTGAAAALHLAEALLRLDPGAALAGAQAAAGSRLPAGEGSTRPAALPSGWGVVKIPVARLSGAPASRSASSFRTRSSAGQPLNPGSRMRACGGREAVLRGLGFHAPTDELILMPQ